MAERLNSVLTPLLSPYNSQPFCIARWLQLKIEDNDMSDDLFLKIINREIPADIVFEDDQCLAFKDINPQAPMHILIIPKIRIPKLVEAEDSHQDLLGHLMLKAKEIAKEQGYGEAFRLVINNGADVGQTVFHLHLHILGGRDFSWPPG